MSQPSSSRHRAVHAPHGHPAGGPGVAGATLVIGYDQTSIRADGPSPSPRSSAQRLRASCTVVALAAGAVAAGSTPAAGSVAPRSATAGWTMSSLASRGSAAPRSGSAVSRGAAAPTTEAPPVGVRWQWPIQPRPLVLEQFTAPAGPYAPGRRGVALAAEPGQPVEAAGAGTVAFAGLVAGVGSVTVEHGSVSTTYQPVVVAVSAGVRVVAGTVLGTVAVLPQLCAPRTCLKWGAYVDRSAPRQYVDPIALLGDGPVRLRPPTAAVASTRPVQPPRLLGTPTAGIALVRSSPPVSTRGAPPASPARTPADPSTAGASAAASAPIAAAARRDSPSASPWGAPGHPVQGSGPPSQSSGLRSSMRPGGRRVIEQLGAVGLVATVVGGGGLLLPVIERLLSFVARRRPRPLTRRGR